MSTATTMSLVPAAAELGAFQNAGLDGLVRTIANRPEVAPLLAGMLRNLSVPLGGLSAGERAEARALLLDAFEENGATIDRADVVGFKGFSVSFAQGHVCLWLFEPCDEPVAEVPADLPDEPAADDAVEVESESMAEVAA